MCIAGYVVSTYHGPNCKLSRVILDDNLQIQNCYGFKRPAVVLKETNICTDHQLTLGVHVSIDDWIFDDRDKTYLLQKPSHHSANSSSIKKNPQYILENGIEIIDTIMKISFNVTDLATIETNSGKCIYMNHHCASAIQKCVELADSRIKLINLAQIENDTFIFCPLVSSFQCATTQSQFQTSPIFSLPTEGKIPNIDSSSGAHHLHCIGKTVQLGQISTTGSIKDRIEWNNHMETLKKVCRTLISSSNFTDSKKNVRLFKTFVRSNPINLELAFLTHDVTGCQMCTGTIGVENIVAISSLLDEPLKFIKNDDVDSNNKLKVLNEFCPMQVDTYRVSETNANTSHNTHSRTVPQKMLIGRLIACERTGNFLLKDGTASILCKYTPLINSNHTDGSSTYKYQEWVDSFNCIIMIENWRLVSDSLAKSCILIHSFRFISYIKPDIADKPEEFPIYICTDIRRLRLVSRGGKLSAGVDCVQIAHFRKNTLMETGLNLNQKIDLCMTPSHFSSLSLGIGDLFARVDGKYFPVYTEKLVDSSGIDGHKNMAIVQPRNGNRLRISIEKESLKKITSLRRQIELSRPKMKTISVSLDTRLGEIIPLVRGVILRSYFTRLDGHNSKKNTKIEENPLSKDSNFISKDSTNIKENSEKVMKDYNMKLPLDWMEGVGMPDDKMNLILFIRDEKKQHIQTKIVLNDLNDTVYPLGLVPGSVVEIAHLRTMFAPTESYLTSTYGTIVSVVGFDESWEDLESMPLRHLYEFLHSNTLDDDSYVVEGHFTNLLSASSSVSGQSRKIDVQDSFVLIFEFTDGTASVQILLDQNSAKILNPHVHSAITSKQSMAFSWRRPQDPPDVLTPLLTSGGETFSKYWRMLIVKIKYTRMFRVLSLKAVDYAYASANILRSLSFKS